MILWTSILLVLANLGPLYGVWALDWSVTILFFFYWLETLVIAFFTILKMWLTRAHVAKKIFFTVFFGIHCGAFMFGHLLFLLVLVTPGDAKLSALLEQPQVLWQQVQWTAAIFFVSHLLSFVGNYVLKKEYRHALIENVMISIYSRIGFTHLIILASGWIYLSLMDGQGDASIWFMSFAVGVKMTLDLWAHWRNHRLLQKA